MRDAMDIVCVHELVQGFLDQVLGLVASETCNAETADISSQTEVDMTAAGTELNVWVLYPGWVQSLRFVNMYKHMLLETISSD